MRLEYEGTLTAGYYNDMEAGYPVFIDGQPLSDVVKDLLQDRGLNHYFCYLPGGKPEDVDNELIGKKVKLILEVVE